MPRAVPRTQGVSHYGGDYYLALHLPSGPSRRVIPRMQMLLLLLSRFSHVRLCATPYTAAHQALVNSKSKLHFTEETVKFRKVNDSPRDTLQAILSSEWNPVVLLQRRTQTPQGASLSAGPGRGSDHDCR